MSLHLKKGKLIFVMVFANNIVSQSSSKRRETTMIERERHRLLKLNVAIIKSEV